jgi:hypothetical protein
MAMKAYNILLRKREYKRPVGRQKCRWDDKFIMDLMEMGAKGVDWIQMALEMVQ